MRIRETHRNLRLVLCWLWLAISLLWAIGCGGDEEKSPPTPIEPISTSESDSQPIVPTDPPKLADVVVAEVTRAGIVIRWKTDIPATSQVEYGETTNYGRRSRLDSRRVVDHEIVLKNLNLSTDYHFRVLSSGGKGQPTTVSQDGTFTTASPSFSQDILPIFEISCSLGVRCHAVAVGLSELKLTSYDLMIKGGQNGNPIVPGNAEASLLFQRIIGQKPPPMPLDNPALKQKQIDLIKKWIDAGARKD